MRFLLPLLALLLAVVPTTAQHRTLVVEPGGPWATITAAVAEASAGDRIVVRAGTYREPTLVLAKPLTLEGDGWPVLDGEGKRGLVAIVADDVTVRGLVLRNVGTSFIEDRAAVQVDSARGCVIENNRLDNTFFGIYLAQADGCTVRDNVLRATATSESYAGNGIHAWYSRHLVIEGNDVRGHRDGIYLEFVEQSQVQDNLSVGNLRYGLHFMYSDYCRYAANTFRENGAGVAVMYTRHVVMENNRFEANWGAASFGLLLKEIADSEVRGNVFTGNTVGLYAESANRVAVDSNSFVENGWAVKLMANATDSRFTANNFERNTFDVATNSRRAFSTFAGNYWDQYQGYDLDRDGVGDVPYRPVRLFSLLVERHEPALILMRSFFIDLLDAAERVLPVLTPETLLDENPAMRRIDHDSRDLT